MHTLKMSLVVVLLLTVTRVGAQGKEEFPPEQTAALQVVMDETTANGDVPGMVLWVDTPTHQFIGTSGYANVAEQTPMPFDGAFQIASITKMFTATVILQLAEEDALSLDDSLSLWLPDIASQLAYGDQITLYQLLSHTSGIPGLEENIFYSESVRGHLETDHATASVSVPCDASSFDELLNTSVYTQPARFEPGEEWEYNDVGYGLLGLVIEAVTQQSLADAYRSRILEPLGMTSTYLDCFEDPTSSLVHGYSLDRGIQYDVTAIHNFATPGAAGLISTAPDLIVFTRALFSGSLFHNPDTLETMLTPALIESYGLGVTMSERGWGHSGAVYGYGSWINYQPQTGTIIILLMNSTDIDPLNLISVIFNHSELENP